MGAALPLCIDRFMIADGMMKNIPTNALYPCIQTDMDHDRLIQVILNMTSVYASLPAMLAIGRTAYGELLLLRTEAPDLRSYGKNKMLARVEEKDGAFFVMRGAAGTRYPDIRRALIGLYSAAAEEEPAHRDEILAAQRFEQRRCDAFENFTRSSDRITVGVNGEFHMTEIRNIFLDIPGVATFFRKVMSYSNDNYSRILVPDQSNTTGASEILAIELTESGRLAVAVDGRRKRWFDDYDRAWKAFVREAVRHPRITENCSGHQMMDIRALASDDFMSSDAVSCVRDFENLEAPHFMTANGRITDAAHVL